MTKKQIKNNKPKNTKPKSNKPKRKVRTYYA